MTQEFADNIISFKSQVSGTYNGNSFAIGMVRAVQTFVTEQKQLEIESISKYMYDGCKEVIKKTGINALVDYIGNKGCVTFLKKDSGVKVVTNYQEYVQNVDLVVEQLYVFFSLNRGLWVQPRDEWSKCLKSTYSTLLMMASLIISLILLVLMMCVS
jgi:glutamate-1-semialdehyde aminotransferase